MDTDKAKQNPLFPNLDAENDQQDVSEIESLCLNCHEQGSTRLMLTKIPFFREVIVSSFSCDFCGHSNTDIQSAGTIQEKGMRISLDVTKVVDLNRQVIKSESATFSIPLLEFEQPPVSRKGEITTVEGLIDGVINGLEVQQPQRKDEVPDVAEKIDEFIEKLKSLKSVKRTFQIVIDDPSGNSFIENPNAPNPDDQLKIEHYTRTAQQNVDLGVVAEGEAEEDDKKEEKSTLNLDNEVLTFKTNCSNCSSPCDTNMKLVDIPFFKQVVIMCTVCDHCGVKENEVKGGAGIEPKGRRYTLKVTDPIDMSRDVLKSDTCAFKIPELDLELMEGTLGGKFTTLEGLITDIVGQLSSTSPFTIGVVGDSTENTRKARMDSLLQSLNKISKGETMNVHLILDDPAGNSYLQNIYAPEDDPEMVVEQYERSYEQNENLGINDMVTENYITDNETDQQS